MMKPLPEIRITNIKISGEIIGFSENVLQPENISDLKVGRWRTAFRPIHLHRMYIFILGKFKNHINITGLTSYNDISKVEEVFSKCCVEGYRCEVDCLRIDSMSFSCRQHIFSHFYRLLKSGNPSFTAGVMNLGWSVRIYPQFPGIVLHIDGPVFTLFRSGCLTGVGFKSYVRFEEALEKLLSL